MFRQISDSLFVSPQISREDVAEAKDRGICMIVNNRPDDEEAGQPSSAEIGAAAKEAGIAYVEIPITHAGFSGPQIDAMREALSAAEGPVLAYCRTGTRSTLLWSLASARDGMAPDRIASMAGAAGYDITPIRPMVDALASAG